MDLNDLNPKEKKIIIGLLIGFILFVVIIGMIGEVLGDYIGFFIIDIGLGITSLYMLYILITYDFKENKESYLEALIPFIGGVSLFLVILYYLIKNWK